MHLAAYNGQSEICRVLLEARASPNAADCHGQTPMFFAPSRQVCDVLYRSYADMNCTNLKGQSALHLAARAGLGDILVWLSGHVSRAALGLRDADGATAADYARGAGVRLEVLEKLDLVAAGGHGGRRPASPRRLGAPPPAPGVDLSWELPGSSPPRTGAAPELPGPAAAGAWEAEPASALEPSAVHLPGSPGAEPGGDFLFRSVAGGAPGHLDQRRSLRGELQERQARNAAKQDAALARRMTAREL